MSFNDLVNVAGIVLLMGFAAVCAVLLLSDRTRWAASIRRCEELLEESRQECSEWQRRYYAVESQARAAGLPVDRYGEAVRTDVPPAHDERWARHALTEYFTLEELELIPGEIGLEFVPRTGERQDSLAARLVESARHLAKLQELVWYIQRMRPAIK